MLRKILGLSLAEMADFLTLIRGIAIPLSLLILWLGEVRSFSWLAGLLVLGWITDIFDGKLARKTDEKTRVGDNDIYFDMMMLAAGSCYLIFFPLHPLLKVAILFWTIVTSWLAIQGHRQGKILGWFQALESSGAFCLTVGVWAYVIATRIIPVFKWPDILYVPEAVILAFGLVVAAITIPTSGFGALRRVIGNAMSIGPELRAFWRWLRKR